MATQQQAREDGRKVRYAVVGAGWISQAAFMPGVAQTGNSVMTAVVTGDAEKSAALAGRYGLRGLAYGDYRALLGSGEIDAVYVAVPNHMHQDYAIPALEAGIHVLLEKPSAASLADSEAILPAAAASRAKLMLAYRLHFEPGNLEVLRRLRAGTVGEIRTFASVFSQHVAASNHRAKSGYWAGPVADMGPYPINAVRNLFGAEPVEVAATGFRTPGMEMGFHDTVAVTLRFPDERAAQFSVSYAAASVAEYRVTGTEGDLFLDSAYGFGPGTSPTLRATVGEKTEKTVFPVVDQFAGETRYFSDCVLDNRDPEPDGEEGHLDMRVIAAIERALDSGTVQSLPPATRARRIDPDVQQAELPLGETPELVDAHAPGQG